MLQVMGFPSGQGLTGKAYPRTRSVGMHPWSNIESRLILIASYPGRPDGAGSQGARRAWPIRGHGEGAYGGAPKGSPGPLLALRRERPSPPSLRSRQDSGHTCCSPKLALCQDTSQQVPLMGAVGGTAMSDPIFSRDVRPITDFKVKSAAIVEQTRRTKRPVLITQRGRGVAVVVGLEEYESMKEELAFGRAIDEGAEQAKRKEFASSAEVAAVLGKPRR